ncbi:MAG: multicopper oxidase domain-containing protein [Candidatus Acidiferrum sp.]
MPSNRRAFLRNTALAGAGAAAYQALRPTRAWPFAQSPTNLRKFVTSLPGLGPTGKNEIGQYLPLATKHSITFGGKATDLYNIAVTQYSEQMHPDLPGKTDLFGYTDLFTFDRKYLGGVIVAKRGTPVILTVSNLLPNKHILPVDGSVMAGPNGQMVMDLPVNRITTHLHGGLTPWFSDGTPFQWYTPTGKHGPSFMNIPGFPSIPGTGTHYYTNDQSARLVWYHDHAIGITRLNAYAGIASGYIITDDFEAGLVSSGLLPDLVGIPLIIQDKGFVPTNIHHLDPSWQWGDPGDLWYPHEYEVNTFANGTANPRGRWDWGPTVTPPATGTAPLPPVSLVPEAFFDTIVINGGIYPKVSVPPKRVRFRLLNGSQARFYHLNLYPETGANSGEAKVGTPGPTIYQVGTEGGFLPAVAILNNTTQLPLDLVADPTGNTANPDGPFNLLLAPAERADVVIDFNGAPAGSTFILYNDTGGPFPMSDPRNDYFTGDGDQTSSGGAPNTLQGFGPNTRTLLKIVVAAGSGDNVSTSTWLGLLNAKLKTNFLTGGQPGLLFNNNGDPSVPAFPFAGFADRSLTLNEDFDDNGRLIQTLGTFTQNGVNNQGMPTWGRAYLATPTETPRAGTTEVWQIMNNTADTHPVHFHLVNVQLIQRQAFTGDPNSWSYNGSVPTPPDDNEVGWKETVRMNPGEITTVIMKFDLPKLPTAAMRDAVSPRTGGKEYVWHCHILEHEEHDMMRPLIII